MRNISTLLKRVPSNRFYRLNSKRLINKRLIKIRVSRKGLVQRTWFRVCKERLRNVGPIRLAKTVVFFVNIRFQRLKPFVVRTGRALIAINNEVTALAKNLASVSGIAPVIWNFTRFYINDLA